MVEDTSSIPPMLQKQFCDYLEATIGLYISPEHWQRVQRKLKDIASAFEFENAYDCIQWLLKTKLTKEEMSKLVEILVIKESYFFRFTQTFEALSKHILPEIIQSRQGKHQHIRILCAASATGEEPYSIAMTLHKLIPNIKDWDITILGVDINLKALEMSREGKYRAWSLRSTPPDMKKNYFVETKDGFWELSPAIRKMVKFGYMNLVDEIQFSGMDLIFCNNTLIYFSQQQIEKTIAQLTNALVEGGWLCVSAVEVPLVKDSRLATVMFDGTTFFRKRNEKYRRNP